jgi:hypothetical protein
MMNKLFFNIGCVIIIYSFLAWLLSPPGGSFGLSIGEVMCAILLGVTLVLPEVIYQVRQFLSSKSQFDE